MTLLLDLPSKILPSPEADASLSRTMQHSRGELELRAVGGGVGGDIDGRLAIHEAWRAGGQAS